MPPDAPGSPPTPRRRRILLVDDEEDQRASLRTLLTMELGADIEIVTASDAYEATRALAGGPFDLIVTDYWMPGVNGVELIRSIKKAAGDVPCVVLSGFVEPGLVAEARTEARVDAVLAKPVDALRFMDAVHESLDAWTRRNGAGLLVPGAGGA